MKYAPSDPQPPNLGGLQQYIDLYQQNRELIDRHSSPVMNAVRDQAFEDFKRQGFPSHKVERYKYTDIEKLFAPDYGLNLNRYEIPVNPYDAFKCDVPNLSTQLYFVVNDMFYRGEGQEAGSKKQEAGGIIIGSLKDYSQHPSPSNLSTFQPFNLSTFYARLANTDTDAVTALNTMLAQDGLLIYVSKGVKIDKAIQIINILKAPSLQRREGGEAPFMVNRRVLIVLEDGAEAKLLFCDHAADDCHFLTTQVIEVYVGKNAQLGLYCLEETHAKNIRVSNVYIKQQADSCVHHNIITLHNGITRNRLDVDLCGEGAQCRLGGCVIADKQQHVDNNTLITHHVPHCTSHELYKYVLDGQATGAFAGRVLVEHGAQKTDSQMRNQNLCATSDAHMFTQPMLEIYADDVKCSHGSTVGQLNDAALFYMRQRGISEREAKLLLQQAFVTEVIDQIDLVPLRDRLRYLVDKRFRGELSHCEGCKLCR